MSYIGHFSQLSGYKEDLDLCIDMIRKSPFVVAVGNGGSETIASHVAIDFLFAGISTFSLSTPAVTTAISNDLGYEQVYERQIESLQPGGCLIAISSSGNSKNIVNAIYEAQKKQYKIITLSGFKPDNAIRSMGDINLYVPYEDYGIVEVSHMMMLHYMINVLRGMQ